MRNQVVATVMALLLTGAALKLAADGMAGETVKKAAKFITSGYGSI